LSPDEFCTFKKPFWFKNQKPFRFSIEFQKTFYKSIVCNKNRGIRKDSVVAVFRTFDHPLKRESNTDVGVHSLVITFVEVTSSLVNRL
jgi:hypothetical protein